MEIEFFGSKVDDNFFFLNFLLNQIKSHVLDENDEKKLKIELNVRINTNRAQHIIKLIKVKCWILEKFQQKG